MLTFGELSQKFLSWCKAHQSQRTHQWYANYINMFNAWPGGAETLAIGLKPYQVQEWIDSHGDDWGDNYRGGAVVAVKRVYNWAIEQGYLETNPIQRMKRPSPRRREEYMTPDDYQAILYQLHSSDPFLDFFLFVWNTGARPQEARHVEARHVELENERIVFPAKESKGKKVKRVIYMQGEALEIITRLYHKHPEGKLFRNKRGEAWTKYSICNRFYRLSEIIGKRVFCYGARHGFATRKIKQGINHMVLAPLMGHTDGSMLGKVYSHIGEDSQHLKNALKD